MIVLNAVGGDEAVYRLSDSDSFLSQEAIVSCTLHRQGGIDHACLHKFPQCAADFLKIWVVTKALQHFCQNQVTDEDWGVFQSNVQKIGLWIFNAVEIINPDAGVNNKHG